jgi:hypothetical protein
MLEDNESLRELHLKNQIGMGIDNMGVRAFTQALTTTNHTLAILEVDGSQITEDVMSELQYALLFNNQPLTLKKSVDRLARNDETLTSLDLSKYDGRHRMTDVSVRLLCAMLVANTTVAELNLSDNTFTDAGFACVCDVLRTNNTLTSLDITNCPNLTAVSLTSLAQGLKANHSLAILKFDKKRFPANQAFEDVECAVRINSVPMGSQSQRKLNPHKSLKSAPQAPSQQAAILSVAAMKAEDASILDDALRVWK